MLKKAQVSFFAILGLFLVIVTAAIIMTNSRISQSNLETELAKQEALNEDRAILEWHADDVIRTAALEALNDSIISHEEVEEKISRLFAPEQFTRRGAYATIGYPSVTLTDTGDYLIVDVDIAVKIEREWGNVAIAHRSVRIGKL